MKSFSFFLFLNLSISCESVECVYYNIKIISSPNVCVKLLPQEDVLGLVGDLGICPPSRAVLPASNSPVVNSEIPIYSSLSHFFTITDLLILTLFPPLFLFSVYQFSVAFTVFSAKCGSTVKHFNCAHSHRPCPGPPTTLSWKDPTLLDSVHFLV